jgi:hypothetical protein
MLGADLAATIRDDTPARPAGLFGGFGHYVSVTVGRYVYMRAPVTEDGGPLHQYSLIHLRRPDVEAHEGFDFTQGFRVWKQPYANHGGLAGAPHLLFDVDADPHQQNPLDDPALEQKMIDTLVELMRQCDAPADQYERLGWPGN